MEETLLPQDFGGNSMQLGCQDKDTEDQSTFEDIKIKVEKDLFADDQSSFVRQEFPSGNPGNQNLSISSESNLGNEISCLLPKSELRESSKSDGKELNSLLSTGKDLSGEEHNADSDSDRSQGKDKSNQEKKEKNPTHESDKEIETAGTKSVTFRFNYKMAEKKVPRIKETAESATLKAVGQLLEQRGLIVPSVDAVAHVPESRYLIKSVLGCIDDSLEKGRGSEKAKKNKTKRSGNSVENATSLAESKSVKSVKDMLEKKKPSSNSEDIVSPECRSPTQSGFVDPDDSVGEKRTSWEQTRKGTGKGKVKNSRKVKRLSESKTELLTNSCGKTNGEVNGKAKRRNTNKAKRADVSKTEQPNVSCEQTSEEVKEKAKIKNRRKAKIADVSKTEQQITSCEQTSEEVKDKAIVKRKSKIKGTDKSKTEQTIKREPEEVLSIGQTDPNSGTNMAPAPRMILPKQTIAIENVTPTVLPNSLLQSLPVMEFIPGSQFVPYYFVVQGNEPQANTTVVNQVTKVPAGNGTTHAQQGLISVSSAKSCTQTTTSKGLQSGAKTNVVTMFPSSQNQAVGLSQGNNTVLSGTSSGTNPHVIGPPIVKQELMTAPSTENLPQTLTSPAVTSGMSLVEKADLITPMKSEVKTNVVTMFPPSQSLVLQNPVVGKPQGSNTMFSGTTNPPVVCTPVAQQGLHTVSSVENLAKTLPSQGVTSGIQTNVVTVFPPSQNLVLQNPEIDLCKGPNTIFSGSFSGKNLLGVGPPSAKQELVKVPSAENLSQTLTSPSLTSVVSFGEKADLDTPTTSGVQTNVVTMFPPFQSLGLQNPAGGKPKESNTMLSGTKNPPVVCTPVAQQGLHIVSSVGNLAKALPSPRMTSEVQTNVMTVIPSSKKLALQNPEIDLCKGPNTIFSGTQHAQPGVHTVSSVDYLAKSLPSTCMASGVSLGEKVNLITPVTPGLQTDVVTMFPPSQCLVLQNPAAGLSIGNNTVFACTSSTTNPHVVDTSVVQKGLITVPSTGSLSQTLTSPALSLGVSLGEKGNLITPTTPGVQTNVMTMFPPSQNPVFSSQAVGLPQGNKTMFPGACSGANPPDGILPISVNSYLTSSASLVMGPQVNPADKRGNSKSLASNVEKSQSIFQSSQSATKNTYSLLGVTKNSEKIHIVPEIRTVKNIPSASKSAYLDTNTITVNSNKDTSKREKPPVQGPEPRNIYQIQKASRDVLAQHVQVPASQKLYNKGSSAVENKVKTGKKKDKTESSTMLPSSMDSLKIHHKTTHFPKLEESEINLAALAQKDGSADKSAQEEKITLPFSSVEESTPLLRSEEIKQEPELDVFPVSLVRSYLPAWVKPSSNYEEHDYCTIPKWKKKKNSKSKPKGKKKGKASVSTESVCVKQEDGQRASGDAENGEILTQPEAIPLQNQEESEFEDSWDSSDDEYMKNKQRNKRGKDSDASYNPGESESEASEVIASDTDSESDCKERGQRVSSKQKDVYVAVGMTEFTIKQVYNLLVEEKSEEEFVCKNCGESVTSKTEALSHMLEHRPYKCLPCNETFPSSNSMRIHMKSHDVKFCCTYCPFSTCVEKELNEHTRTEHEPVESEPWHTWVCHICGHVSNQLRSAQRHMQFVHDSTTDKREGDIECPVCKSVCISHRVFRSHMLAHLGKFFYCSEEGCTYKTTGKDALRNHVNNVHTEKTISCPFEGCGMTMRHTKNLDDHMNMVHYKIRKFKCTCCNKGFLAQKHLIVHMRIHTDMKPVWCKYCDYKCRQQAALNWHMKKKHPDKEIEARVRNYNRFDFKPGRKATKSKAKKKSNSSVKDERVTGEDGPVVKTEKRTRAKRKRKSYSEETDENDEYSDREPILVKLPRPKRKSKVKKKSYCSEMDGEVTDEDGPVIKEKRTRSKRKKKPYCEETDEDKPVVKDEEEPVVKDVDEPVVNDADESIVIEKKTRSKRKKKSYCEETDEDEPFVKDADGTVVTDADGSVVKDADGSVVKDADELVVIEKRTRSQRKNKSYCEETDEDDDYSDSKTTKT